MAIINDLVLTPQNIKSRRWRNLEFNEINLDRTDASSAHIRMCAFTRLSALQTNLTNVVFENNGMQGSSFHLADFTNASLIESDFSRSSFESANLDNADFESCNLRGADFRSAVIINTSFRDADLRGADFTGATIKSVDFTGADLRGAIFDPDVEKVLFAEKNSNYPPAELIDAVAPIVASMLKQAENNGMLSNDKWKEDLQETLAAMGACSFDEEAVDKWDEQVSFWLTQVGKVGVEDLFESLRSGDEKTPEAIATMLEGFVKELGLQPGVSTGELIETLFVKLKKN